MNQPDYSNWNESNVFKKSIFGDTNVTQNKFLIEIEKNIKKIRHFKIWPSDVMFWFTFCFVFLIYF